MENTEFLDFQSLPQYKFSCFRKFIKGERHIERISTENVLLLVLEGTLIFEENGKEITLRPNEYYIQKAGGYQCGKKPSLTPYYYFVHFDAPLSADESGLPIRGVFSKEQLMPLIYELNQIETNPNSNFFQKSLSFMKLLNCLDQNSISSDPLIEKMCRLMQNGTSKKYHINDLAAELGYSKDYLIKKFKNSMNITPHQYLINLRINKAKSLLMASEMPLSKIVFECGFDDPSTFHRNFLKETGVTPYQFKLQNKKVQSELMNS